MYESIHVVSVLGIIGKSEYVSYDLDQQGLRVEITRYPFDPQAIPTDLNDLIGEGITRHKTHVVLDMGNIPWINSKGLGTLVMLFHKVKEYEGELVLARPVPDVTRIIEVSGIDKVLKIFDSVVDAREYLQGLQATSGV